MTQRGHSKLLYGGFEFVRNRINKVGNTTVWDCSQKRQFGCKGKAQTRQINSKEMVKLYGMHNHFPNNEPKKI